MVELVGRTKGGIVECGSGLSSLVGALLLEHTERYWTALEHNEEWAGWMEQLADDCGLNRCRVVAARIHDYGAFDWYGNIEQSLPEKIELVVCDGPPASTRGGRLGALHVLATSLAPRSWLILDDTDRRGEREILNAWQEHFATWSFSVERDTGKWCVVRIEKR
jgi:hypothetical protein